MSINVYLQANECRRILRQAHTLLLASTGVSLTCKGMQSCPAAYTTYVGVHRTPHTLAASGVDRQQSMLGSTPC